MKKIFYLSTCDTCRKIMKEIDFSGFEKQDIKTNPITTDQINDLKNLAGSFEALFSRKARKYKELGLKDLDLTEQDFQHYILSDYTFLKRPVVVVGDKIFIGSDKKNVEALKEYISTSST